MTARLTISAGRFAVRTAIFCAVVFTAPVVLSTTADAPLPVDEAFPVTASFVKGKLALQVGVMPGHYLYRDRFEFRVDGKDVGAMVTPKLAKLTQAKVKNDPTFGKTTVFDQSFPLEVATLTSAKTELELVFQGCSEVAGICYPPAKRLFTLAAGAKNSPPNALKPTSLKNLFKPQVSQ